MTLREKQRRNKEREKTAIDEANVGVFYAVAALAFMAGVVLTGLVVNHAYGGHVLDDVLVLLTTDAGVASVAAPDGGSTTHSSEDAFCRHACAQVALPWLGRRPGACLCGGVGSTRALRFTEAVRALGVDSPEEDEE